MINQSRAPPTAAAQLHPRISPRGGKAAGSRQHKQAPPGSRGGSTYLRDLQHCTAIQVKGWSVGDAQ